MKTKKEDLIQALNDVNVDEFNSVIVIAQGESSKDGSGTVCYVSGSNEDVLASLCMAYEQVPALFSLMTKSIEAFGLGMRDTVTKLKDEKNKIVAEANA